MFGVRVEPVPVIRSAYSGLLVPSTPPTPAPLADQFPLGGLVTVPELERDFHGSLARVRASEPVSWVPALGGWLVTGRDLVVSVLRDPKRFTVDDPRFSTQRVIGPSMLSLDGADHTRHRDPFEQAFRRGDPVALRERMATTARLLIDVFADNQRADLRTQLAAPLAVAVMVDSLGLVGVSDGELLSWYAAIVASTVGTSLGAVPSEDGVRAMESLRAAVKQSISESELLHTAGQSLSIDELVSNVAVLLFGGVETSEAMTANAFVHLFEQPELIGVLRADPSLVARFVEESVRIEPAAGQLDRYATSDVTLGSVSIRAGDFVICSVAGANRDPQVFARPDRFLLERDNAKANLSFAQGPHACLATHVAKAETEAALRAVISLLPNVRWANDASAARISGVVFRKADAVPVMWGPAPIH